MMKSSGYIFYQFARPVSYLFIKHEDKYIYDWSIPILFSLAIGSFFGFYIKDWGEVIVVISSFSDFSRNLPGFFIAALAAIATFNRPGLDDEMEGDNPPSVYVKEGLQWYNHVLTRRRFLCLLFSYLTVESIFLSVFGMFIDAINLVDGKGELLHGMGYTLFVCSLFLLFACQMITCTLHGLYYLAEKAHI